MRSAHINNRKLCEVVDETAILEETVDVLFLNSSPLGFTLYSPRPQGKGHPVHGLNLLPISVPKPVWATGNQCTEQKARTTNLSFDKGLRNSE